MYVYKLSKRKNHDVFRALVAANSKLEARALLLTQYKDDCEEFDAGDLETMELELQDYTVNLERAKILMGVCVYG